MGKKQRNSGTQGLLESMAELKGYLDKGMNLEDIKAYYRKHHPDRIRTYTFRDPGRHTPAMVKRLRASLGMSQASFARLIGVSAILVQSWERGVRMPSPLARRLLDTISRDPKEWVSHIIERKAG